MQKNIRNQYEQLGVTEYYKNHSKEYKNPHGDLILLSFYNYILPRLYTFFSDNEQISFLDLACGDGIISSIISKWFLDNKKYNFQISGSDPYMYNEYNAKLINNNKYISYVFKYGFEDIIKNELFTGEINKLKSLYDIIIISFAIHLLDIKHIRFFLNKLSHHTKYLLIISPTKNKGDFTMINDLNFINIYNQKFSQINKSGNNDKEIKVFFHLYQSIFIV